MTDGRIPGKWMNEPRFIEMDANTWCVFTKAIAWSNEAGTDGFIKWRYLSLLHPDGEQPEANAELVELGLWTKMPTGYQLLDWDKPAHQGGLGQSTAEYVRTQQERNRKKQQEYRDRLAAKAAAEKEAKESNNPEPVTGDVTGYVTGSVTGHIGHDTTRHAQTTEQLGEELQQQEQETKPSSWPCPEPDCTFVLTEKNKHLHDCRGYREERNVNRLSDDNWDDRFGASSVPWDPQPVRESA